jgi:hypothetical protein
MRFLLAYFLGYSMRGKKKPFIIVTHNHAVQANPHISDQGYEFKVAVESLPA